MKLNQRIYKTFRDSKVNLSSFLQEFKQSIKVMDTQVQMLMIQLKHAIMIMPNGDQWPIDIVLLPTIYSTICFMTLNTRRVGLKEPD